MWDIREVKKFWENRSPLFPGECYTLCIAARSKYLPEDQKSDFKSSKMIGYTQLSEGDDILGALYKTYSSLETVQKVDERVTDDISVIYTSLNPCDIIQGYKRFTDKVEDILFKTVIRSGEYDTYLNRLPKRLCECIQATQGTRHWLDIDIDLPLNEEDLDSQFREYLRKNKVNHYVIKTHGGFHLIIDRPSLKKTNKPIIDTLIRDTRYYFEVESDNQIEVCKSNLIPLPGSFQAGQLVEIIL